MDDDSFKTELLSRLERIQSLLSYLCGAAKASEERAQAAAAKQKIGAEKSGELDAPARSLLQDEMLEDYNEAIQKWKAEKF